MPFARLLEGKVHTTYGTDFDCIAEHMLEHNMDKAVILTDGYASMSPGNTERLKKRGVRLLTVLFGGKTECPELEPFGDVLQLQDVTT